MITDFPTAPLAPGLKVAGGGTVEKSLSASHTEIRTLPIMTFGGVLLSEEHLTSPSAKRVSLP